MDVEIEREIDPMSKQAVRLRAVVELQQAIEYLEDLAESLKKGSVCVSQGGEQLTLSPASLVELQLEVQRKGLKESLSFDLGWRAEPKLDDRPLGLRISAAPEPPPAG